MKKLKSLATPILFAVVLAVSLSSCMTTKTNVGAYRDTQGKETTYAKGKQLWLFWGLVPLGQTSVNTPADGNCQVVTRLNFGDFLISGLTGGIIESYTIKVKTKNKK